MRCGLRAGPLDLGAESDQLIIMLYGTGIRNAKFVSVAIGGLGALVLGFAPQSQDPGRDQVNVRVPRELAGDGEVELLLKADGGPATRLR